MKIRKLHIENYKSLKTVDFDLNKDINIFIGKNNSGKSNLLDALMYLSQFAGNTKRKEPKRDYNYLDVVFAKKPQTSITYELHFTFSKKEQEQLFAQLGLQEIIDFNTFQKRLSNEVKCKIKLQNDNLPLEEEVYINFDGEDVLYAKGQIKQNMYQGIVLESFKDKIQHNNRNLKVMDGRSPGVSIFKSVYLHSPNTPEEHLVSMISDFLGSFISLSPVRESPEQQSVQGTFELTRSCNNLPQLLNSIASSLGEYLDFIEEEVGDIIEEVKYIRAPLLDGSSTTYITTTEKAFSGVDFNWRNIASGTKEIIFLVTMLQIAPRNSLLLVEEPELHLHTDAIWKIVSLMEKVCKTGDQQILVTTHSPNLIDQLPFDKLFTVVRESGQTTVIPLKEEKQIEDMLYRAGIPSSWLLQRKSPSYLLIVEGRDDVKVWGKFLERQDINPIRVRVASSGEPSGGHTKSLEIGKFIKRVRIPTPFKIIVDSDNKHKEKEESLKKEGFKPNEYHILSEKEIESYLIDAEAISNLTAKSTEEVEESIVSAKGSGKEKLKNIFLKLGFSEPDDCSKEYLAAQIDIPDEILLLIKEVKESLK